MIRKGTLLYRAAPTVEEQPKVRFCNDTWKTGVYFAGSSPFLAETMTIEYFVNDAKCQQLEIAVYELTEDVEVSVGKYASKTLSHMDSEVTAIYTKIEAPKDSYEVFLTEEYIKYVKYLRSYTYTVQEAMKKYGVNNIFLHEMDQKKRLN